MNRKELFKKIVTTLERYGAKKIAIFGSYARNEAKPESDIDIIVNFSERKSLLVGIEQELSDTLVVNADLITEKPIPL